MRWNEYSTYIRQFPTPNGIISAAVAGKGPLVILMHGWPELGFSYRHQIKPLVEAGFQVAAPDMRGYGGSAKPFDPARYTIDAHADDMAALANALGAKRWVSVGHDWGSPVAWRCALRFPDQVAAVFSFSVPHRLAADISAHEWFDTAYANRFYYMRYFETIGPSEMELERDPRDSLKRIFFSLSGDAPLFDWTRERAMDDTLLNGLTPPPDAPLRFMPDADLDAYANAFSVGGFHGPLNWYRNWDRNEEQARAYGDQHIRQPAGIMLGDREIVLSMFPGCIEAQRPLCHDLRIERVVSGAGHWIQQERPADATEALLEFLADVNV
ncbi:MAG: alpha/beta hydrolase [Novosphingobium sp.]|nr:alpha/beta hydrolase [Novosphingobium sp.]